MQHRRRSFKAGTRKGVIKSWDLTDRQQEMLSGLYNDHAIPKLGPTQANGTLNVGPVIETKQVRGGILITREKKQAVYTPYNLADHYHYFQATNAYLSGSRKNAPEDVVQGAYEHALKRFNRDLILPCRSYLEEMGISGVQCWFYVCPQIEVQTNPDSGRVGFKYSDDWPICIIPKSLTQAIKRWGIDNKLAQQLALSAGWLVYNKLISLRLVMSIDEANRLIKDWRGGIADKVFDYFQSTVGPKALQSEKSKDLF